MKRPHIIAVIETARFKMLESGRLAGKKITLRLHQRLLLPGILKLSGDAYWKELKLCRRQD